MTSVLSWPPGQLCQQSRPKHVHWPPGPAPFQAWNSAFIYIFVLILLLYLVYIALLFCYMCKLFQIIRKRRQDPMKFHMEIFRVLLRKGAI